MQTIILILSALFSVLILTSSFFYFLRTPHHPHTWLLSIVVSAYYGPCLSVLILLLGFQLILGTTLQTLVFTSVLPLILITATLYRKWKIARPGPHFSWWRLLIPQTIAPKPDLSIELTTNQIPVDFYFNQNPKSPLIFFFFGGGFENNDHKQHPHFLKYLTEQGYHVASVGYRQLPHHPWPQPLVDIENVINLIMRQAPSPQLSPHLYIIMGRSAGGFLSLSASRLKFHKPILACLAIYPVTDLSLWSAESVSNSVLESRRRSLSLLQNKPELFQQISLIHNPLNSELPYYVVSGDADPVVDCQQTLSLQESLNQQKITNKCLILRTETHGFDFHLGSFASQLWLHDMMTFLKSVIIQK